MIYTTYFSKLNKLPPDIIPISICGKAPDGYNGLQYKKLAPKYSFFAEWKKTKDNDMYIREFNTQVLNKLCPTYTRYELFNLAGQLNPFCKDIALVCYEKPSDFCHRHLVAQWFKDNGIECEEFIYENS